MKKRYSNRALQDRAISLSEAPRFVSLDRQRFQCRRRNPGQFRTSVYKCRADNSSLSRSRGVLDFDIDAKRAHLVMHNASDDPPSGKYIDARSAGVLLPDDRGPRTNGIYERGLIEDRG